MKNITEYLGEALGTFILVLIGTGSVAVAVLYGNLSLVQVALIWWFGVSLAIFMSRKWCPAHLNPAVSVAMVIAKQLPLKQLPAYVLSQCIGALFAGVVVLLVFNTTIEHYELTHNIIRGSEDSYKSAMMFGEYFPNPGFEDQLQVSHLKACIMEGFGTFILVLVIFILVNIKRNISNLIPMLIGLTVCLLIIAIAPYTQGGFNPARDFAPRLVAYIAGWESAAFPKISGSFFTVYIVSPIIGGGLASLFYTLIERLKI